MPHNVDIIVGGATMTGWLPIFDTMHGVRGEVNVMIKVELFSDYNKFRESSCGVPVFCSKHNYMKKIILITVTTINY